MPKIGFKEIKKDFSIYVPELRDIIKNFLSEMDKGLADKDSSLKMIPTYIDRPSGRETGKFIALDLGGTNFRVLSLELKGGGKASKPVSEKFALNKEHITGDGRILFDFIAQCVRDFLSGHGMDTREEFKLGFTFSFPVEQTGIASGTLLRWTKGFSAKGVIGEDVVRLLNEALLRKGLSNIKITALANDTVGTLMAKSYEDPECDIGIILGTGTNACYVEKVSSIIKWRGGDTYTGSMIINTEWGNFNKLRTTSYDKKLDKESKNPGGQVLEKMVSGMYLGEICRLVFNDLARIGELPESYKHVFAKPMSFKSEDMSEIESDHSGKLTKINGILKRLGIDASTIKDRALLTDVCEMVSTRASRISSAAACAILLKMDRTLSRKHTIAIDGSVYEKHPGFSKRMKHALEEILKKKASNISMVLAKDGSGKGAAIISAVADNS